MGSLASMFDELDEMSSGTIDMFFLSLQYKNRVLCIVDHCYQSEINILWELMAIHNTIGGAHGGSQWRLVTW